MIVFFVAFAVARAYDESVQTVWRRVPSNVDEILCISATRRQVRH